MGNFEKEHLSLEEEELIRARAEKARKSIFSRLRNKVLVILGTLLFSASSLPGVSISEMVEHFKSKDKIVELDKSKSEEEVQENIFENQSDKQTIKKLDYIIEKIGSWVIGQLGYSNCSSKEYDSSLIKYVYFKERPEVKEGKQEAKKNLIKYLNQKPEIKIESEFKEPVIMDSMKQIDLEPEIIKMVLKTLPPSWLKGVSLITYLDKPQEIIINEKTGEKVELVAYHQSGSGSALGEIYFFPGAKTKRADQLLFTLIWEFAHANNWHHRRDLTPAQRISLLYEVIKRIESPDRLQDKFIESITYNEEKKKEEIIKKAIEYWAMICMWTIAKPLDKSIPEADKRLVLSYLKLTDPEFDVVKAAELRENIILQYLIKKGIIKIEEEKKTSQEEGEAKYINRSDYTPYLNI